MSSDRIFCSTEEIRKVFRRFDKNGDGRISYDELSDAVRALTPSTSSDELDGMLRALDEDGDGHVDFEEFVACFATHGEDHSRTIGGSHETNDLKAAFDVYDLDGDGKISASELHVVLRRLGENFTVADCARMIRQVDADGDGHVDFEEFKKMMASSSH